MLKQRQLYTLPLIRDVHDFGPEMRSLEKQGFVVEDDTVPGGWRVRPQVFLWWLSDELVRAARGARPLEEWLQEQELGGLLTRSEKRQLDKAVHAIVGQFKDGAASLIQAAAKGMGIVS